MTPTAAATSPRRGALVAMGMVLLVAAVIGLVAIAVLRLSSSPFVTFSMERERPAMVSLPLPPGARLSFSVRAEQVTSASGRGDMAARIELLREEAVVLSKDCRLFHGQRGGTGVTFSHDDCDLTVPATGADALRVTWRWGQGTRGMTARGTRLIVYAEDARGRDLPRD